VDSAADATPVAPWRGYARGPGTALALGFLLLGLLLLGFHLHAVDWHTMGEAIRRIPARALVGAVLLTAASYATYCCFDLLGRRTTGHALDRAHVLAIGFVSHACVGSFFRRGTE